MTTALILAGGRGARFGAEIPKQFVEVLGKPVIVYTLENFQRSPDIDAIEIVCRENYFDYVWQLARTYGITKLRWVHESGPECQDSIRNGVLSLQGEMQDDDMILIHMANAPLITQEAIAEGVRVCREHGNSFPAVPVFLCMGRRIPGADNWTDQNAYKEDFVQFNTPWAYRYGTVRDLYLDALKKGRGTGIKSYTVSLMFEYGMKAYYYDGCDIGRLKITTPADLEFFEGYLLLQQKRKEQNNG